jgi:hypothetical protein
MEPESHEFLPTASTINYLSFNEKLKGFIVRPPAKIPVTQVLK